MYVYSKPPYFYLALINSSEFLRKSWAKLKAAVNLEIVCGHFELLFMAKKFGAANLH